MSRTAGRTPPRWSESAVGGHKIRVACTVDSDDAGARMLRDEVVAELEARHFRRDTTPLSADGTVVLRRGTHVGDVLLGGSGLELVTSRLGPLSLRGVVVVTAGTAAPDAPGAAQVIVSLVAGDGLAPEVAAAVDDAVDVLSARGVPVGGAGWTRAIDLPAASLAHPAAAAAAGIH